jgi:hypothetical protein
MSAGQFSTGNFYQSDAGDIYTVRVQPETLALTIGASSNNSATGPATVEGSARVQMGNREFGVKCRRVTLRWTGAVPTGYYENQILSVPCLTSAFYNAVTKGATGTYLGQPVEVVSKIAQVAN